MLSSGGIAPSWRSYIPAKRRASEVYVNVTSGLIIETKAEGAVMESELFCLSDC